jgi:hypothetical protein
VRPVRGETWRTETRCGIEGTEEFAEREMGRDAVARREPDAVCCGVGWCLSGEVVFVEWEWKDKNWKTRTRCLRVRERQT